MTNQDLRKATERAAFEWMRNEHPEADTQELSRAAELAALRWLWLQEDNRRCDECGKTGPLRTLGICNDCYEGAMAQASWLPC